MGVIVLLESTREATTRDYGLYDAYLNDLPVIFNEGEGGGAPENRSVQPRPTRQDVGNNPWETRPESGDIFGQGDFSHGAGQQYFHRPNRDPAKYLRAEGLDIETPGKLRHLHRIMQAAGVGAPRALEQTSDQLFVTDGTGVKRTTDFSVFTTEDPHAGEVAVTVLDLAVSGAELFAALGVNGLHRRTSAAAWAHHKPDGVANLDTGDTRLVRWLRARPWVVGQAGRAVYEILNVSNPAFLGDLLPEGWTFTDIFEAGTGFIYVPAVNPAAGLSRVFHFALKSDASGFEPKGSSAEFPGDQLFYAGCGFLGRVFLAGGKKNDAGGYDPVIYQAVSDNNGFLHLEHKLAEGSGAGAANLSVRKVIPEGETLLFGWSLGADNDYGAREGMAIYYPSRAAFAHHHHESGVVAPSPLLGLRSFKGHHVWVTDDGLYHDDRTLLATPAVMISSIGDWNNAGEKTWDLMEVHFRPLPEGASLEAYYTTKHPEENEWALAGTIQSGGSTRATFALDNVTSSFFAWKLVSNATTIGTAAPEVVGVSVRSNAAPNPAEWILVRYLQVGGELQKNENADIVYDDDPNATAAEIENLLYKRLTFYEQPGTWRVRVEAISVKRVAEPQYDGTQGETVKNVFHIQIVMQGSKEPVATEAMRLA